MGSAEAQKKLSLRIRLAARPHFSAAAPLWSRSNAGTMGVNRKGDT
jgi:hypothetical protein